jgi:hypothetical protein
MRPVGVAGREERFILRRQGLLSQLVVDVSVGTWSNTIVLNIFHGHG